VRNILILTAFAVSASAETHTLTIQQAVDRAVSQNPEVVMARMDELKANAAIRVAKDPFSPHVGGGSGLAYSYGYPLSIEGSAPSIFQTKATQDLLNRPQSFVVAQAKENARGAGIAAAEKRDDLAYRVATMFVDVERTGRLADSLQKQVESLEKIYDAVDARVQLGRELPVAKREAYVNLLRVQQRLMNLQSDRDYAEHNLASVLGFSAGDTVQPAAGERPPLPIPATEEAALQSALGASKVLKRLDSNFQAKVIEVKGDKAQRLPRVDLVAQYALLSQYSHYDQYFLKFQRNNAEIGASIQIPIWAGPGVKAQVAEAEADQQHIRAEMVAERNRITLDVHQSFQELNKANVASQLAKAELDLAHEQLSVLLAQMNEGRASLRQVEDARSNEDEKWISFYDAQFSDVKARMGILRQTGELVGALK
jgi:outer membrane protein TolC